MPFFEPPRQIADLVNIAPPDEPKFADPTLGQTFGAAFRTQNVVGSFMTSRGKVDPYEIEEGFDAIDYVKDEPEFAPYVDEWAGIFNRKAAEAKKSQIRRENEDRLTLDAAGGMGILAQLAAGVVDLPTLLPLAGPMVGGGRTLGMAVRVGIASGLDAGVSEVALQATQATRTTEESLLNIGGSLILGGALGALAGKYLSPAEMRGLSLKIERQAKAFEDMDRGFAEAGAQSAGAAARDAGPLRLKDEELISRLPIANQQDPMIRLQLSRLDSARQTVRGLAETPLEYKENAAGIATERGGSVETRVKMWNAPLYKATREIDTEYARYFNSTPEPSSWQRALSPALSEFHRLRGGQKLTFKQFKEEVGRAAYLGGEHEIPEVARAAKVYRDFDEALKQAAIDARLFPEDVDVAGDISHRFRMYDRERIIAERTRFREILSDYFQTAQQSAAFRAEEIRLGEKIAEVDRIRGQYDQSFQRLEGLEERLNARQAAREAKLSAGERLRQDRFDVMKERAPEPLVKMLRGTDENASMIEAVRESRRAARASNKKQPMGERQPVLAEIRSRGGVRIGSKLDAELRAMGVTPKTHPGMFRKKGGLGDIDNFVRSEDEIFENLPADQNDYVDPSALYEAIRDELAGQPLRSQAKVAADELAENMEQVAGEWLDRVGLPENATVGDVRKFIARVLGAEKNLDELDTRVSRLEGEIEDFDRSTDAMRNERDISASEARVIADRLEELEAEIDGVADLANASPRVGVIVDYSKTKRDLFKAKLKERNLTKRVEALRRLEKDGKANADMLAELAAKNVDLGRVRADISKISAKADRLQAMQPKRNAADKAEEFADLSKAEIDSLVDDTIDTILGNAEGRLPYDIVAGPRGPLKERVLKIETAKIHDFVVNDIEEVMRAQLRTMGPDIELAKKYGSVDLAEELRKINDEANAKIGNAESVKERQRLEKARKDAVRDVEGIRDRLRGTYALPSNPASLVLRTARVARNLNYVRLLGGMTLSAIPDMAKVVFTHGMTSTFRDGFLPMVRNFKAFRLAGEEVKAAGTALDMVLDSRTMALADITDDFGRHSKFERGLSAVSSKFGVVSLMAPWNAAMKQFAGLVTMTNILRGADEIVAGTASPATIRKMAAAGIDADLASRIASEFSQHGEKMDGVWVAQGANWLDKEALEALRAAVVRDVDRIIVTPGQDRPLWMSTELGKVIGQFKSFAVSSMQKTMLSGIQQRDAATMNGTLLMMALGAVTYAVKETNSGRELSDDPAVWAVEAFDRSGLTGWLMEANNIAEKATRGRVGLSGITGEQVSRYSSRNVYGAFLGPSADAVADIFQVSGSIFAGDTTKSDLRRVRQMIPTQNLFYLRGLFNQVEAATGDALGLPDTARR
jgi:hypothetical protein